MNTNTDWLSSSDDFSVRFYFIGLGGIVLLFVFSSVVCMTVPFLACVFFWRQTIFRVTQIECLFPRPVRWINHANFLKCLIYIHVPN